MDYWKIPPVIKVYEALGAVADERVEIVDVNRAQVRSSDGSKTYDVLWDPKQNAIMANDNGSYWVGYLGYPSIAFLMTLDVLPYDEMVAQLLKGVEWKALNAKHKNDFDTTMKEVFSGMSEEDGTRIEVFGEKVLREIEKLGIGKFGKRMRPPKEG